MRHRAVRTDSLPSFLGLLDGVLEASHRVHRWFIPLVGGHHALPATTPKPPARIPPRRLVGAFSCGDAAGAMAAAATVAEEEGPAPLAAPYDASPAAPYDAPPPP